MAYTYKYPGPALTALPELAFDHDEIVRDADAQCGIGRTDDTGSAHLYYDEENDRYTQIVCHHRDGALRTGGMMPIGMSQICSCNWIESLHVGLRLNRGDEMGYFLFGDSDIVIL